MGDDGSYRYLRRRDHSTTKRRLLEYDPLGRITSVCQLTTVGASGACNQNTAETGFLTTYTYDALNDVTQIVQNGQSGASQVYAPQTRSYGYDELGRMTSETNRGVETDDGCLAILSVRGKAQPRRAQGDTECERSFP
jgi:hypothetical protein